VIEHFQSLALDLALKRQTTESRMSFPIKQDIIDFADAWLRGRKILAKGYAQTMAIRLFGKSYIREIK
jgi:hypothetical protein